MRMATELRLALITCPPDRADALASALVEGRHAACVNIVSQVRSVYRWQGEVQRDAEALLLVKTTEEGFEPLRQAVLKLHPYELPEVIAVRVEQGHLPYLRWVIDNVALRGA